MDPDRQARWEARHQERMARWEARHQARMARHYGASHGVSGAVMGIIILAVGALFLLQNLGVVPYIGDIWQFWPVILIALGISKLARTHWTSGIVLTIIGAVFLLNNLGYIYGNVWLYIWPMILIGVGASMLLRGMEGGGPTWSPSGGFPIGASVSTGDALHVEILFHGVQRKVESQNFEGGRVNVVFGGAEIDLREARTTKQEIVIRADAVFGGIVLWVPADWNTVVRGTGVFGGFDDKTYRRPPGEQDKTPRLIVTGSAVFGGVTVKN